MTAPVAAPYREHNLLDRVSRRSTLELHYVRMMQRERAIVDRRLGLHGGEVLSVGAGWHPGRHLFPSPAFKIAAVDADPSRAQGATSSGRADLGRVGLAGHLDDLPDSSFDVVLYRLVLHHIA